jgi:hypothetical protein
MASKFLEEVRRHMRMRGYSLKTEKAYLYNQFLQMPLGDLGFTYAKKKHADTISMKKSCLYWN